MGTLAIQNQGNTFVSKGGLRDGNVYGMSFTVSTSVCSPSQTYIVTLTSFATSFAQAEPTSYGFQEMNSISLACTPPPSISDEQVQNLITNDFNANSAVREGTQEYIVSIDSLILLQGLFSDSNGYNMGYCAAVTYGPSPPPSAGTNTAGPSPPATGTQTARLAYTISFDPDQASAGWSANYGYNFSVTC